MNVAMWILAGGILGWLEFPFIMRANAKRGSVISMVIGAVGGFAGEPCWHRCLALSRVLRMFSACFRWASRWQARADS